MTAKMIDHYLEALRAALEGADPATVQDALADAEDHLTSALEGMQAENPDLPEDRALENIIAAYGTPEETASAYEDLEMRIQPSLAAAPEREPGGLLSRFFGVFGDPRAWGAFLYLFVSFATGIIYFVWATVGISLTVSLALFIFGLLFAVFFVVSSRWIGLLEGRLVEALLGVRMPRRPAFFPKELPWRERLKFALTNRSTWTILLYMLLQLPLGTFYFSLFVTLVATGLALITAPFMQAILNEPVIWTIGGPRYLTGGWQAVVVVLGFLIITISMHLAKLLGGLHGRYAKVMLVSE